MAAFPLRDPQQELVRARDRFADALAAAEVPEGVRIGLHAACEAVAKAFAVVTITQFIEARQLQKRASQ